MDTYSNPEGKRAVGPMIGLIVILGIIVLGSLYFWNNRASNNNDTNDDTGMSVEQILSQSSSDEINAIEADLNAYGEADIDKTDSEI